MKPFLFLSLAAANAQYNSREATDNVFLAAAAYCQPAAIESWTCNACALLPTPNEIIVFQDPAFGTQAYVARHNDTITVAFRGTEPSRFRNWLVDLDAVKTPYHLVPNASVHTGFLRAYEGLSERIN
jgi:hypothetical protein